MRRLNEPQRPDDAVRDWRFPHRCRFQRALDPGIDVIIQLDPALLHEDSQLPK